VDFDLSLGSLIVGGFISLIGLALVMYGKKEMRVPHIVVGVILIIFPYFVGIWWLELVIAAAVLAALAVISHMGW
jgi:hypothetical protein